MKAKVKLDKTAIKEFFVDHAEKLVLAVVILLFGGWVYSGVRQPTFEKTPQDLQTVVSNAKQYIETSKLPALKELEVKPYRKQAAEITKPIPPTPYMFVHRPTPVDEEKAKRGTPVYYAIEDIQVAGGMGAFAIATESGGGVGYSERPAPVVRPRDPYRPGGGAVTRPAGGGAMTRPAGGGAMTRPAGGGYPEEPVAGKKTRKKPGKKDDSSELLTRPSDYERPGAGQYGPRGLALPSGAVAKYKFWAVVTGAVPVSAQAAEYARCFQHLPSPTPQKDYPEYVRYDLERAEIGPGDETKSVAELSWQPVDPIKAFAERKQWAPLDPPEVVAPEYVHAKLTYALGRLGPLLGREWDKAVAHPKIPLAGAEATDASETSPDAAPTNPNDPFAGSPEADAAAMQPRAQPGGVYRRAEPRAYGAYGAYAGGPRRAPVAMPGANAPGSAYGPSAAEQTVPYYLFRCFDFTVEPGKRYRYRVRLQLDNPNKGFAPVSRLADPATAVANYGETPWSETSLVTIPRASSLLAGAAKAAPRPGDEPTAEVMVRTVDVKKDTENVKKIDKISRGEMANYSEKKGSDDIRYQSDLLLCDVRGGGAASKGKTDEPAELIFLDADGRLVVQSEAADAAEFQQCLEKTGEGAKEPDIFGARMFDESSAPAGRGRKPPGEVSAPAGGAVRKPPRALPRGG